MRSVCPRARSVYIWLGPLFLAAHLQTAESLAQEFHFHGELHVQITDGEDCLEEPPVTYPVTVAMEVDEDKNFNGFIKVSPNLMGQIRREGHRWVVAFRHYDRSVPEVLTGTMTVNDLDMEMILERDSPTAPCGWQSARVLAREIPGGSDEIDSFATCSREYEALELSQVSHDAIRLNDISRALAFALKAYDLVPDHPVYAGTIGMLYDQQGDKIRARQFLKEAYEQELEGGDHNLIQQLGDLLRESYEVYPDWVAARREEFSKQPEGFDNNRFQAELEEVSRQLNATQAEIVQLRDSFDEYERFEKETLQGLKVIEEHLGKNHMDYWEGLEVMARMLGMMKSFEMVDADASAEKYLRAAISLRRQNLGANHPDTLESLGVLARFFEERERSQEAQEVCGQMAHGYEELLGRKHPRTAAALTLLADQLTELGELTRANELLLEILDSNIENLGPRHPTTITQHRKLARHYMSFGAYEKAEPHLLKARETSQKAYGDNDLRTLRTAKDLAVLYQAQNQWEKARDILLELFDQIEEDPPLEEVMSDSSSVTAFETWKSNKEARRLLMLDALEQSIAAYEGLREYQVAGSICLKLIELYQEIYGDAHPKTLMSKSRMAHIHDSLGLFSEAKPLHEDALTGLRPLLQEGHPGYLLARNNMAAHHLIQNRFREAAELLEESYVDLVDLFGQEHPKTLISMANYSYLLGLSGEFKKTAELLGKYFRLSHRFLERVIWTTSEEARTGYLEDDSIVGLYYSVLLELNTPQAWREMLFISMNRKGIDLRISSQIRQVYASSSSVDQDSRRKLADLKEMTRGYYAMATRVMSSSSETDLRRLRKLGEKISRLEVELLGEARIGGSYSLESSLEERLGALQENQIFLDFIVFNKKQFSGEPSSRDHVVVLVIRREEDEKESRIRLVDLGPAEPIGQQLGLLRRQILAKDEIEAPARALYDLLWSPLLPHLEDNHDVLLIPDGMLHLLPFEVLQDPQNRLLVESQRITYLSRAENLEAKTDRPTSGPSIIYFDPDFDLGAPDVRRRAFAPLPGTRKEGIELSSLFESYQIPFRSFTQGEATELALVNNAKPRLLHLATHGYFLDSPESGSSETSRGVDLLTEKKTLFEHYSRSSADPLLRSGLALAGANLAAADETPVIYNGIATAKEVLLLDLWGTEMVVLSACETGVGSIRNGEGVYSLSRAFQEAGAQRVLFTLWRVDDEATRAFMVDFYSRYLAGTPAREALLEAKSKFAGEGRWQHPYYWAPFIMVGES